MDRGLKALAPELGLNPPPPLLAWREPSIPSRTRWAELLGIVPGRPGRPGGWPRGWTSQRLTAAPRRPRAQGELAVAGERRARQAAASLPRGEPGPEPQPGLGAPSSRSSSTTSTGSSPTTPPRSSSGDPREAAAEPPSRGPSATGARASAGPSRSRPRALAGKAGGRTLVEERGGEPPPLPAPARARRAPRRGGDRAGGRPRLRRGGGARGRGLRGPGRRGPAQRRPSSRTSGGPTSELLASYESSIEILSKTLDLRDHETEGHSPPRGRHVHRPGAGLRHGRDRDRPDAARRPPPRHREDRHPRRDPAQARPLGRR